MSKGLRTITNTQEQKQVIDKRLSSPQRGLGYLAAVDASEIFKARELAKKALKENITTLVEELREKD